MTDGKLVSGFEGQHCSSDTCLVPLTAETGAYLHKNRDNGKLVVFCEACSLNIQLNHALRFPLVVL